MTADVICQSSGELAWKSCESPGKCPFHASFWLGSEDPQDLMLKLFISIVVWKVSSVFDQEALDLVDNFCRDDSLQYFTAK